MHYTTLLSALLAATLLQAQTDQTMARPADTNLTITATQKSPLSLYETTSDVTLITAREIERYGDLTLADAIRRSPGLALLDSGSLGQPSSLFMRGQSAGSVMVLLDGMRLNDPSTTDGRAMIEHLMADNIQQIEIIRGGLSAIWGNQASAGLIQIITPKPSKGVHGTINLQAGSYGTYGGSLRLTYGSETLFAQLFASTLNSDGFSALAPREAEADDYQNRTLNFKLGYRLHPYHHIQLAYYSIDGEGSFDDRYNLLAAEDRYSNYTASQENYALSYHYTRNAYQSRLHLARGDFKRDYFTHAFDEARNHYEATIDELTWTHSYRHDQGKLTVGLEAKSIQGLNHYSTAGYAPFVSESTYDNRALFIADTYRIGKNLLLEGAIRLDGYDAFSNQATYKAGVAYTLPALPDLVAKANYHTAYDAPSAYQMANTAMAQMLQPTSAKGYDLGLAYGELFSLTYFDTTREDTIAYDFDRYGYFNALGTEHFSGVELAGGLKLPNFSMALSANYTRLFDYESEISGPLPSRAKEVLNLGLDYFYHQLKLGLNGIYVGDRLDVSGSKTGRYTLWGASLNYPLSDTFSLGVYGRNLFDRDYQSVEGYATEGRSIYATLRYRF
jgi:vitamin B12 transporter